MSPWINFFSYCLLHTCISMSHMTVRYEEYIYLCVWKRWFPVPWKGRTKNGSFSNCEWINWQWKWLLLNYVIKTWLFDHQMALHIFLQSLITLPIWYIYWYISYMDNIGNGDVIFWQVFPRFSSFIKKGWNWIWGYHHQFWLLNWYTVRAHIKSIIL